MRSFVGEYERKLSALLGVNSKLSRSDAELKLSIKSFGRDFLTI